MTQNTVAITHSSSSTIRPEGTRHGVINSVIGRLNEVLLGKEEQIKLSLSCLFANGHLLIEDQPGMGKTLLSHALARVLGLSFNRIQFTSDMLPSDILGMSIFDKENSSFRFLKGPIFAQLVLADEINRATPKSQSALLEAMEEYQVTIEGETRKLPSPFFVIATQNPESQTGTFPLPESQLDRFLMRIHLGYPDPDAERELLMGGDRRELANALEPMVDMDWLKDTWQAVQSVKVTDPLVDYIQRLVQFTRREREFSLGLSPRGSLALLRAARAWALIHDRSHVVPEDVQAVLPSVVEHRLRSAANHSGHGGGALSQRLLARVDVVG